MSDNIRVVAIAFFRRSDKKYLLCRRGPAESGAGSWEFPGGKVDAGETEKQALVREIQEELAVDIQEHQLFFVSEHSYQYPEKNIQISLYKCDVDELAFSLVDHDQAEWSSLDRMQDYQLAAADIPFIEKLKLIQK
jgi:8-oxo-dGTP diphosphatase